MPDRFQEFSYLSYPSPPGSAESPAASNDASSAVDVNLGFTGWTQDHDLDALYAEDVDMLAEFTEEDLKYLTSIPLEDLALPEAQNVQETLLFHGLLQAQNMSAHAQNVSLAPLAQRIAPSPLVTQPVPTQLFSPAPSQQRQLPSRAPALNLPLAPSQPGHPQPLRSHPVNSADTYAHQTWPPVPPSGERQRLALPAPGDLNYSACEVIM